MVIDMDNIQEYQAHKMVSEFIFRLKENMKLPPLPECEDNPKSEWIPPLIEGLEELIVELSNNKETIAKVTVESFDSDWAEREIHDLIREIGEDLEMHENIRGSDDQYSDPQEWWLSPLFEGLKKLERNIYFNARL